METYPSSSTSTLPLFVGMDVHKKTIAVCVYDHTTGEIVEERQSPNDWPKIRKYMLRLQKRYDTLQCCYEVSSCGYALYRALHALGVPCEVIA